MEALHAIGLKVQTWLLYRVEGVVPVWAFVIIGLAKMIHQWVKVQKWTSAQNDIELIFRFILKLPIIGVWIAAVPFLGSFLKELANDPDKLPPTFSERVKKIKAKKAKADPAPAPAPAPEKPADAPAETEEKKS